MGEQILPCSLHAIDLPTELYKLFMAFIGFTFQYDGNTMFYTFAETSVLCPYFNSVTADFCVYLCAYHFQTCIAHPFRCLKSIASSVFFLPNNTCIISTACYKPFGNIPRRAINWDVGKKWRQE